MADRLSQGLAGRGAAGITANPILGVVAGVSKRLARRSPGRRRAPLSDPGEGNGVPHRYRSRPGMPMPRKGPLGRQGVAWARERLVPHFSREDISAWAQKILEEFKDWLIANNVAVIVTLLVVFALLIVGSGFKIVF